MRGEQYLTESEQFAAVYEKGASWADRLIVLKSLPNGLGISRYGFSVSSRVGGAVIRNLVKRRLREIMRQASLKPGLDIVIIARPVIANSDFASVKYSVCNLLSKARIINMNRK
jgi:ribonuclease P protein component